MIHLSKRMVVRGAEIALLASCATVGYAPAFLVKTDGAPSGAFGPVAALLCVSGFIVGLELAGFVGIRKRIWAATLALAISIQMLGYACLALFSGWLVSFAVLHDATLAIRGLFGTSIVTVAVLVLAYLWNRKWRKAVP